MAVQLPKEAVRGIYDINTLEEGPSLKTKNIEYQIALDRATGQLVQRGIREVDGNFPATTPGLQIYWFYQTFIQHPIADWIASSFIGKYLNIKPGDENPLRWWLHVGYISGDVAKQEAAPAGQSGHPPGTTAAMHGGLPTIVYGLSRRGLQRKMNRIYPTLEGGINDAGEIYRFRDIMKGAYGSPRYAYATASARGSRRLDLTD
ncbi:MAG: hypothetical protein HYX24_03390 [Candidatus Aenigmarchaeota archaeon]|nr:hypothetical protein [Candidatus Aenigmarchaeota archaeon]